MLTGYRLIPKIVLFQCVACGSHILLVICYNIYIYIQRVISLYRYEDDLTEWLARNKGKCEKLVLLQDWQRVVTTKEGRNLRLRNQQETDETVCLKIC
jgi:hypothetical protein